jgi:hypothetical protein
MSEEVKKAINMLEIFISNHKFYNIKHSDGLEDNIEIILELIRKQQVKINAQQCLIETQIYNVEVLEKELNNLKEIEQSHQEENGKLRVELEKYKLLNANIEKANKIIKSNKLNEKEREIIETYRKLIEETGRNDWIICNPKTMWSNYFVRKDKIQEKIEEYEGLKILDKQAYEEQIKPLKELLEDNNG